MEVDGVGDGGVVDVEEDDEVLLRLLYQVLHFLLKGAHEAVVHFQLAARAAAEVALELVEARPPRLPVVAIDGLELIRVDDGRREAEDFSQRVCGQDVRRVLEVLQLRQRKPTSISSAFSASTACRLLSESNSRLISCSCTYRSTASLRPAPALSRFDR